MLLTETVQCYFETFFLISNSFRMTINMPVQTLFIQSTSKVSLNSRFTQMMNKRKPSNEEFIRPTSKSERVSFIKNDNPIQ